MRRLDVAALAELAALSVPTEVLQAAGFQVLAKSGDLHRFGYNVVFWLCVKPPHREVIEYRPRRTVDWSSTLPRVTVDTYEAQVKLHQALGLGVVGRGEHWHFRHNAQPGLFG